MTKPLATFATVAAVALSALALPTQADARHRFFGPAIVGGLAAGALFGAFAAPRYGYAYHPYYPAYYPHDCHVRKVWGPYGWHVRRVCY